MMRRDEIPERRCSSCSAECWCECRVQSLKGRFWVQFWGFVWFWAYFPVEGGVGAGGSNYLSPQSLRHPSPPPPVLRSDFARV